jgi:hypothetical protein
MADTTPTHISSLSRYMGGINVRNLTATSTFASTVWYANNQAVYLPFSLPWSYTINRVFCANGATASGNVAMGIYTVPGVQLYGSASTAQAGTSNLQYISLGSPLTLAAGNYFFGLELSSTVGTIIMTTGVTANFGRMAGLYQQAVGSMPLPTTPTFAAWNSIGYPICGFTRTSSGY